jgi:Spy/CpxP family protein refolding chaperone
MKKLGLLIIAAVFLAGLVAASANAQMGGGKGKGDAMGMGPPGGGMGMGPGGGMGMWDGAHGKHITSMLGLDDNQTVQVKPILHKLQKDMIRKRADIEVAKVELEEILGKDPVDIKVAEAKVKQIASLKAEAAMIHIQGIEDVKAKLTPEQKKKLTEMMQMKGMGQGMMNCPMMEGKTQMGPHHGPGDAPPHKGKAGKTAPPQ